MRKFPAADFYKGRGPSAIGGMIGGSSHARGPSQKIVSAKIHPGIGIVRIGKQ